MEYIVPPERRRRPQRASELCLRGGDLPAPLPVLACHPSNRRAAAAKAHQASLYRLARCPTRSTVNSTRAVHRSLAHLLPKGCCCAVAPQRTVCQANATSMPAPATARPRRAARPATTATTRTSTRSGAPGRRSLDRGATTRPRGPRSTTSSCGRGPPRRLHYPRARPREVPGTWLRSHPTVWTWTGTPIPERSGGAPRARAGLLV